MGGIDAELEAFCLTHQLELVGGLDGGTTAAVVLVVDRAGQRKVLKILLKPSWFGPQDLWAAAVGTAVAPAVQLCRGRMILMDYVEGPIEAGRLGDDALGEMVELLVRVHGASLAGGWASDIPALGIGSWTASATARLTCADPRRGLVFAAALAKSAPCLTAPRQPVLLHGDLHSGNVLCSPDGLRLIDPMPVHGSPGFDFSRWATDPARGPGALGRLAALADAGCGGLEELVRWGALSSGMHLGFYLTQGEDPVRLACAEATFDAITEALLGS